MGKRTPPKADKPNKRNKKSKSEKSKKIKGNDGKETKSSEPPKTRGATNNRTLHSENEKPRSDKQGTKKEEEKSTSQQMTGNKSKAKQNNKLVRLLSRLCGSSRSSRISDDDEDSPSRSKASMERPKSTASSSAQKPKEDEQPQSKSAVNSSVAEAKNDEERLQPKSTANSSTIEAKNDDEPSTSPNSDTEQSTPTRPEEPEVSSLSEDDKWIGTDSEDTRDSTASEASEHEEKTPPKRKWALQSRWSSQDTEQYLAGYPSKKDNSKLVQNWRFYKNEIPSVPEGDYIENILKKWKGDYDLLETHHGYIQWLFPIREPGMNYQCQELQLHEAEKIIKDLTCKERVLRAFDLMLDFYGMAYDREKMTFGRSKNWEKRFLNLSRRSHNWLRITRILKCLGELGWEPLKKPWVEFIINEAFVTKKLAACQRSLTEYWIPVLRVEEEREAMMELAFSYLDDSP